MLKSKSLGLLLVLLLFCSSTSLLAKETAKSQKPIVPKDGPIKLFNGKDLTGFYTFLKDTKYEDPRQVFTVKDGVLIISGDGLGGLYTNDRYADYHMVCEFKWGPRTWGPRKERTKDSGVLVHGFGPDDSYGGGVWFSSVEAQLIQGGCGDFIIVNGKDDDGKPTNITGKAKVVKDRDGEAVWDPKGEVATFGGGRINNHYRDPDWADTLNFRGKEDVENPDGQWNTMEVICRGNEILIKVNGHLVNHMTDCSIDSGKILIQSEWAEIHVRRWDLLPLEN